MVEERLTSLETKVNRLAVGQQELHIKVDELAAGHAELRTEVADLRTEMRGEFTNVRGEMASGFASVRGEMASGFANVRGEMADLRRYFGVLHEETLDKIKALAPDPDEIRREFRGADAALREEINRRLDPLELAVRSQAAKKDGP